jgi:glycoside/pentoside/hexuronide:cation symporter, GPH family
MLTVPRLRMPVVLAYSGLAAPTAALNLPLLVFLPPFFAAPVAQGGVGLSLSLVGMMFLVARAAAIAFNPVAGWLVDNFPGRFGRRRHFIALSGLGLLPAVALIFMPPVGTPWGLLLAGLMMVYVLYALLTIAELAWGADLAADYFERSRLFAWREGASVLGSVMILALPALLEQTIGMGVRDQARAMGGYVLIFLPVAILAAWHLVPDAPMATPLRQDKAGVSQVIADLRELVSHPIVRKFIIMTLCNGLASGTIATLFVFLMSGPLGVPQIATLGLFVYFVTAVVTTPLWLWVVRRFSKHRVIAMGWLYASLCSLAVFVTPRGNEAVIMGVVVLSGVTVVTPYILMRAMLADMSDALEIEQGAERKGLLFGIFEVTQASGGALAVGIVYPLIEAFGYSSPTDPRAFPLLVAIWGVVPALLLASAAAIALTWPLTPRVMHGIQQRLAARSSLSSPSPM